MGDWVLSQVQPYPGVSSPGSPDVKLPRILLVHASRAHIFGALAREAARCCGSYEEKRLRERSCLGRTWYEYDSPGDVGMFAIVQAPPRRA